MTAAFEIAGIAGMLFTGWATDRFFGGRAARVCLLCMVFATAFITLFWLLPLPPSAMTLLLMGAGFCIYGPQALCAPLMANLVTRRGAASAVGVTSLFAYGSTVFSGWGLGLLADTCGWSAVFACLCAAGLVGVAAWLPLWRAKAHNYAT
ncbi:MAG: hypothetical protein LBR12_03345 [Opitutaceae bacterium]|jgi:OPA family glycerol-3-phosphate transporter-like MFS transporter/OPA family sugar phosphate sensor protein UhpC-like MFS transporter|nr:hypothetical protein [Opitutaceae bacterium]